MEANSSYGTSWADQWDYGPDPEAADAKDNHTGTSKYKQKLGDGVGKTKAVAKTGMSKLKEGTSAGLSWIKTKYNKNSTKS